MLRTAQKVVRFFWGGFFRVEWCLSFRVRAEFRVFNCIIFLENSALPDSLDGWFCFFWPETTVLSMPFVRFSLSLNRVLSEMAIGFFFPMFRLSDFSLVSIELICGMTSFPAGSGIVSAYNCTKCCSFFLFGFSGRGCLFFSGSC